MKLTFTTSFERTLRKSSERERVEEAIESLVKALEGNVKPKRTGLKS